MKTCHVCKTLKDEKQFYKDQKRKGGLSNECKPCNHIRAAARRARMTPEQKEKQADCQKQWAIENREHRKSQELVRSYGISLEDFNRLVDEQGGVCAICQRSNKKLVVDHDHKTGKVRSLLCFRCNIAIGLLEDSPKLATDVIKYLVFHGNI